MTILKFSRSVFAAFTLILALMCAGTISAQSGQAVVQGIVSDPSGAVVVGAQVVLTNLDTGDKLTVKTASDGRYTYPIVAPGKYTITVTAAQFAPETVTGLTIQLDNHVDQNVKLKLGGASDATTVNSAVPLVDTTAYDMGGVVEQDQINDLPIQNRQYLGLALLTPGTTQAASRSFYSNVQSGGGIYFYSSGFSWDGVSNQQTEEGDPRQNIPEDAVAEFKTYTASMPAELGWAMGGYTALVTKSGGNKIHGDAFEYYRSTGMTADNVITQASELATHTGSPTYNRNQFGGSIGGPIFKDKTHYYGAYERTQATTSWTLYEPAGSAAAADYASLLGTFLAPQHDQLIVGKIDHNLKPNQQVFFRVALESQLSTANGCGGTTTTGCYDGQFPRRAYVAGHTWEPKSNIVNEARFQYAYISYELGPWNTSPPKKPTDFLDPNYSKNITLSYSFSSLSYGHNYAADGVESRWQVNDSLSIQKGAHSIKIGGDVSYVPYVDASASNLNGTYTFQSDQPFDATPATENALCPTPTSTSCPHSFSQAATPLLYYLPSTQQAYFIQDSWRAKPNLTISAGLRYDLQKGSPWLDTYTPNTTLYPVIPYEGNPHARGDKHNFGPRVGLSWDPFKKSTDVFRLGYGIYYNFVETELSEAEKLNFAACSISLTANAGAYAGLPYAPYPNPYLGQNVKSFCAPSTVTFNGQQYTNAYPNINVTVMAPNLQNPYQHQFSGGYTRQIAKDVSLSIDGLYTRGLRDYKVYDLNLPISPATTRPNPLMASINQHAPTGASEYDGVYFKLTKQLSHKYAYTLAYTLSSAHDNNPHGAPVNYACLQCDWGQSGIDQRNSIVGSFDYEIPFIKVKVGGIFQYRSRQPFSVTTTTTTPNVFPSNPNFNGSAQYIPGTTRTQGNRHNFNWAAVDAYRADYNYKNSCAYSVNANNAACLANSNNGYVTNYVPISTNLNQRSIVSNRYKDFDLRVSRVLYHHESMKVEIIGQAFNLFGTENYSGVNLSPTTAIFGTASAAGNVQIGELAAKFTF